MKALLSTMAGGPETLAIGALDTPTPAAGEVLVRVKACAVNYPDVLIIEDKYQFKPQRPFSPGCEVAGMIEAVGAGVTQWKPGDRVVGTAIHGGMAEYMTLPAEAVFALPQERAFVEGAALLLTYGTSYHALVDRGRIRAGDTLLVLGAAGGVGLAAVELGKALGARVIGAVSSEEKAAAAREAGAEATIIYPLAPFDKARSRALATEFKAALGEHGADLVYDAVGGDYAEPALRAMAWGGRYLIVGFPAGIPTLPFNLPLLKGCDICGVFWGDFANRQPQANAANVDSLFALWKEGRIAPRVTGVYPLERAGEAIASLAARKAIGKLVVELD